MKKSPKHLLNIKKKYLKKLAFPLFALAFVLFFLFFTLTSMLALYERQFAQKIYPGITVGTISFSAKTKDQVRQFFEGKNNTFANASFTFRHENIIATASGRAIGLGFDATLISEQAFSIGRTGNILADLFNKGRAWFGEINLPVSYTIDDKLLEKNLTLITKEVTIAPIDAVFEMKDSRVVAFRPAVVGQTIDMEKTKQAVLVHVPEILSGSSLQFEVVLPITKKRPSVSLEDTNTFGIREHIGRGISHFRGSIPNRMHNIALAASRIDGTIVKPGDVFSFNDTVGDVSKLTGYKEAYIIKDGRTILGDGGGVCQVSTTLFRAILNSGLPVVERHPHSYRVSYYEQDSPPGLDATVYAPNYDLRFTNDTSAAILVEAYTDLANTMLVFDLYGTSDGREIALSKPTATNYVPAPEDRYEDDPTLPKGVVKQIDFKATGASVAFSREIKKDGEVLSASTFRSDYRPWQAVFLRGTKEITQ